MSHVHEARHAGQTLDITNPRTRFVFVTELHEAVADLDAVALDALRSPSRRKLSRSEARRRYQKARAALAWLATVAAPVEPTTPPQSTADEVVAASWEGWEA